ncbi:hypothetical protein Ocin01_18769 [Orchesella cincta]|uniref:Uncharacterized protein n=1 Tax=Orchesella cincta TaxID=48709 RepID=A0A1D2M4L3_ORCCI|nr:hypothetical protein Ocin01_18769 [Orchesella cincta]
MFCNSMCGYPLQKGSRILAILDLLIGILVAAYMLYTLIIGYLGDNESEFRTGHTTTNGTTTTENITGFLTMTKLDRIVIVIIYIIVEGWLFRLLIKASKHLNQKACISWMKVRGISLLLWCVYVLYGVITGRHETIEMTLESIIIIYRMYELVVVAELKNEIEKSEAARKKEALTHQDELA